MVNRKYILGIAFLILLIFGVVIVMAEVPSIKEIIPANGTKIFLDYQDVTVKTDGITTKVEISWDEGENKSMDPISDNNYSLRKSSLTNGSHKFKVFAYNNSEYNASTDINIEVDLRPKVVDKSPDPNKNVNSTFKEEQIFNVKFNQKADISWKIDNNEIQENKSVNANEISVFKNNSTPEGTHSVTAQANNSNGSSEEIRWTWNVLSPPGPPPVDNLNFTKGATWINWTWTNPETDDFNYTIVTINNTFQENSKNNSFNYTKFAPNTINTIKLQTVGKDEVINSTIISSSVTTYNTIAGPNVNVTLNNVTVFFSQVVAEGDTSIIDSSTNPGGSHTFQKIGNYYTISTNSTLSGNITVEIPYYPTGITNENENIIRLYHWNSNWIDITTYRDTNKNSIKGNVTSLSSPAVIVAGLPSIPVITKNPNQPSVETIANQPVTFNVSTDQTTNITWKFNGQVITSETKNPGVNSTYVVTAGKGSHTVTATANNTTTFASNTASWNLNAVSATFYSGNRIWDGDRNPNDFSTNYTWNPQSFSGFYYDAKNGIGTESITVKLTSNNSRTISEDNIEYSTSPMPVDFTYKEWGKYQVIGFMADKYFAGYRGHTISDPTDSFDNISAIAQGQLHKVLFDDDTKRTISVGGTLALKDGYVIKATDIDMNARTMFLRLLKDGVEVDSTPLAKDETYVYKKRVGSIDSLPLILVRFDNVFSGQELQTAFLKGIFQISEDVTAVKNGNRFGKMEVTVVNQDNIKMKNADADVGLNEGSIVDLMGDLKIIVADNDDLRFALSVARTGSFEVRSTVFDVQANNITEWTPYNFGMNIGKTIIGFYYNLDDGLGNENIALQQKPTSVGQSIPEDKLVYSTKPELVKFTHEGWGTYQVIGFMADQYFAGYKGLNGETTNSFNDISAISQGQLHKVLLDDDTKQTISVGSTLSLKQGYVLKATDIDLNARTMLLSLLKDGVEVDTSPLSEKETYVYKKKIGSVSDLPIILVRFENVFSGRELQAAFLKGIFQLSETATPVKVGDQFGKMEVSTVNKDEIRMTNDGSIGLDKNKNEVLMGNIRLKVADSETLRFYFAVDVTEEMVENQLVIDAPSKVMAGDNIKIKVTAGGKPSDNASVTLDTEIGQTDAGGILNYTLPTTLKAGTYNITASKTGYEKATKNIEIEKYVDLRLGIEAPSNADQYQNITIKVLYNGSAMSEASVLFDNTSIGTTDSNGELTYRLETSGTHSITASKTSYIAVTRDIDIRAPYSEFKALDINVTPNPVIAGNDFIVTSNITNVGTKSDTIPVELIINGSAVDNRSVTLGAGEKVEINFTRQETQPANVTVDIMGQTVLLEVQKKPTDYLLIAAIATLIGAIIIYMLTSKGLLSRGKIKEKTQFVSPKIDAIKQKFNALIKK